MGHAKRRSEVRDVLSFSQPHSGVRRVPLLRRCRLQGTGRDALGIACNLSINGGYVAIEPVPRVGEQLLVSLQLPLWEQPLIINAVVCWNNSDCKVPGLPPGCGLEFLALTAANRWRVETVVRAFASPRDAPES